MFRKLQHIRISFSVIACISAYFDAFAQDIHFSQFTESELYMNPSTAGTAYGGERGELNYRQQWSSMGSPYRTTHASFDMPFGTNKPGNAYLGAGLDIYSDKAGDADFGTTKASLAISAVLPMNNKNILSVGLSGGAVQRAADLSKLQWGSQYYGHYDPNLPSNEVNQLNSFIYPDFGLGACYKFSNKEENILGNDMVIFNAGAALLHANKPVQKFFTDYDVRLHRKVVFMASSRVDIKNSNYSFLPALFYSYQKPASELNLGTLLRYRMRYATKITSAYIESALYLGCYYRWSDAIIPQVRLELGNIGFGVSYDINISSFKELTKLNGGIEFSLKYSNLRGATIKTKR